MTKDEKMEHWANVFAKQVNSGMSTAAFCRDKGIATSKFYYWRKRLAPTKDGFVQLQCADDQGSGVSIRRDGWEVTVSKNFDASTLQRVLRTLPCLA